LFTSQRISTPSIEVEALMLGRKRTQNAVITTHNTQHTGKERKREGVDFLQFP
jgi:hypothetical protein